MSRLFFLFLRVWFVMLTAIVISRSAGAVDFCVENRVYSGDQKEAISQSLTIFYEDSVYDFLQEPAETVVFDKAAARFTILDGTRQIRTELTTALLDSFMRKLRERAAKNQDPLARFFADPVFEELYDAFRGELKLQSPWVNYRVMVAAADSPAVAAQYREFSDRSAELNAILNPGSRPPFARLKLNDALSSHECVPREVILAITSSNDQNRAAEKVRSVHSFSSTLTPAQMQRIELARQAMAKYKLMGFDQYYRSKR
jgi:hypothetical protein